MVENLSLLKEACVPFKVIMKSYFPHISIVGG